MCIPSSPQKFFSPTQSAQRQRAVRGILRNDSGAIRGRDKGEGCIPPARWMEKLSRVCVLRHTHTHNTHTHQSCLITLGLTVALIVAEILNVVQVFTPAAQPHALLLFVTVVTVVQRPASRKWQNPRVNPENTWVVKQLYPLPQLWQSEELLSRLLSQKAACRRRRCRGSPSERGAG